MISFQKSQEGLKIFNFSTHQHFSGTTPSGVTVRVGSSFHNSGGIVAKVNRIHQHPQYDPYNIDYDIAVLELEEDLEFSDSVKPIPLVTSKPADGSLSTVTGWGATREGGPISQQLQRVRVDIVNREDCAKSYAGFAITQRMICAGVPQGGKDACQGDSGGPLVVDGKLAGVVSWGYGCARPGYPGVYANVYELLGWINGIN